MASLAFPAPITEIIKKRRSWRTYNQSPVEDEKRNRILQFIEALDKPSFGSDARFQLMDLDLKFTGTVTGTYGVIKGAKTFIAAIVTKNANDMEDVGYLFEKIILFCTKNVEYFYAFDCWLFVQL